MKAMLFGLASLVFATAFAEGYITSVQLPGGTIKKFRDEAAASTNDIVLTPVYSQTPMFSEWIWSNGNDALEQPTYSAGLWSISFEVGPSEYVVYTQSGYEGTTVLDNLRNKTSELLDLTATRTRTDIIGYTLGSQTNKVLAAQEITNGLASVNDVYVGITNTVTKEYVEGLGISGGGGTVSDTLTIASGSFVPSIAYASLYDGQTNGASQISGCYITNLVLNTADGNPQSLTIHLNGTICGRVFDNEDINLVKASGSSSYATATIEDDDRMFYLSYYTTIPDDVLAYAYRGYLYIRGTNPSADVFMYSFAECREFVSVLSEVDATPKATHDKSLITSKAVYDATSDKLKRTGGTMLGSLSFDTSSYATVLGWQVPKYTLGGPKDLFTGQTKEDGSTVAYNAGVSVGTRDIMSTKVKFPAGLWVQRSSSNPVRQCKWVYDEFGIAYEEVALNGSSLTTTDRRLSFPTNSSGAMLDGTIARIEDFDFTNSLNTAIGAADTKASEAAASVQGLIESGLKNPNSLTLSSGGTQVNTYSGEYARTLNFGNGLSASASGASTTVTIDSTKVATRSDLERSISDASEQAVSKLYASEDVPDNTVTAVYVISNTNDNAEYKVAVSTVNGEWTSDGATFFQIDNPALEGSNKRGWLKASMWTAQGVGIVYTNWQLCAYIGTSEPSTWSSYYAVDIYNKATPIFPMEIGEQKATYNGAYYVRKVDQFRGAASGYLTGDGSMYSITGSKTNSLVTVSNMVSSIESAVSPVRSTANSASSGVSSLNTRMNSVEGTIGSLKTVATSGKYSDLTGKPTALSEFTNDSGFVTQDTLTEAEKDIEDKMDRGIDGVKRPKYLYNPANNFAICGDKNIYALSNDVERAIEMKSYGAIGVPDEYAWVHLCDSVGNTYTLKNAYTLNSSPTYYYYRYTRDGGSQVIIGTGANAMSTNGLVIVKRAVYDQYQLAAYGDEAQLIGYTADAFGLSQLDSGGSVTIEGVSYRAKNTYVPYGAAVDRLVTLEDLNTATNQFTTWSSITNWVETYFQRK